MAMVVVWNLKEPLHGITGPHAVYAKSFQKQKFGMLKGAYIFECINSWDQLDKTPLVHQDEIRDLYYVSLFSDTVKAGAGIPKPSGGQNKKHGRPQQDGGQGDHVNMDVDGIGHHVSGGNIVHGDKIVYNIYPENK